jgi:hypothetical protein
MCAGDVTLEQARVVNGTRINDVDGWGAVHICRDWETMFNYTLTHGF